MPKYIAFLVPDMAWDGIGYLYDLINLKPNDRHFALVTAKNMEQARKKYFTDYLYPDYLYDEAIRIELAANCLEVIFENCDEEEVMRDFGEKDGNMICQLIADLPYEVPVSHEDALNTAKLLSADSIAELCFSEYEYNIAISEIVKIIK